MPACFRRRREARIGRDAAIRIDLEHPGLVVLVDAIIDARITAQREQLPHLLRRLDQLAREFRLFVLAAEAALAAVIIERVLFPFRREADELGLSVRPFVVEPHLGQRKHAWTLSSRHHRDVELAAIDILLREPAAAELLAAVLGARPDLGPAHDGGVVDADREVLVRRLDDVQRIGIEAVPVRPDRPMRCHDAADAAAHSCRTACRSSPRNAPPSRPV